MLWPFITLGSSTQGEFRILEWGLIVLHAKHCFLSLHGIAILTKDLLSTLHLLVAIAKHFQPNLAMPPNVHVETITIEVNTVLIFLTVDPRDFSQYLFCLELGRNVCTAAWLCLLISEFAGLSFWAQFRYCIFRQVETLCWFYSLIQEKMVQTENSCWFL